jgi:hypothetical protein
MKGKHLTICVPKFVAKADKAGEDGAAEAKKMGKRASEVMSTKVGGKKISTKLPKIELEG